MDLSEKGRFVPRPQLEAFAESVAATVETWPGVVARTHWQLGDESIVDGADFYVGDSELGHLHLYPEAHIAVPRPLRNALIEAGLAAPFRWSSAFVVKRVKTAKDAREASFLFAVAYDQLKGVKVADLLERIRAQRAA